MIRLHKVVILLLLLLLSSKSIIYLWFLLLLRSFFDLLALRGYLLNTFFFLCCFLPITDSFCLRRFLGLLLNDPLYWKRCIVFVQVEVIKRLLSHKCCNYVCELDKCITKTMLHLHIWYFTKDFEDLYKKVRNCLSFCQDSGGPLYIMA